VGQRIEGTAEARTSPTPAPCRSSRTGEPFESRGVFEARALGRHDPSGFADWLSVARPGRGSGVVDFGGFCRQQFRVSLINMNAVTRPYRMTTRATAAAQTAEKILDATKHLFAENV
jgi:hypothetical protein